MKVNHAFFVTNLLFILLVGMISSCSKSSTNNQGEIDRGLMEVYVLENQLTGQFSSSGLYYEIIEPGDEIHPTLSSSVTVSYDGYTLEASPIDDGSFVTFSLSNLIVGWQEGIPLIGEGGKIKLIIPSQMAYGDQVLVFDITLHYFSN